MRLNDTKDSPTSLHALSSAAPNATDRPIPGPLTRGFALALVAALGACAQAQPTVIRADDDERGPRSTSRSTGTPEFPRAGDAGVPMRMTPPPPPMMMPPAPPVPPPPAPATPPPPAVGGPGMCNNAADVASLQARSHGSASNMSVPEVASACALSCFGNADENGCFYDCLAANLTPPLSRNCQECVGMSVTCSRENCLFQCLGDATSPGCVQCQCQSGCRATFDACSGVMDPTCG